MAVKPEEKQPQIATSPQVVTSPDGKFQIINHRSYFDRFGCYCIDGAVKYVSPEPNLSAEIKVDYYTIEGEFIDTEVETVDFHESGGTSSFFIQYSGLRRGEIQHHVFNVTSKKES